MAIHPIEVPKIEVKQHIPAFVDGYQPQMHFLEDSTKILELEFIKKWEADSHFKEWRISPYVQGTYVLIAMLADDKHFVVAYINHLTEDQAVALASLWQPPQRKNQYDTYSVYH